VVPATHHNLIDSRASHDVTVSWPIDGWASSAEGIRVECLERGPGRHANSLCGAVEFKDSVVFGRLARVVLSRVDELVTLCG
jgi:hypothetical protein